MKLTVLYVKKGLPGLSYYKINERYLKEQEVKFLFFESNEHEFCMKVSFFDDEWVPMNVFHYRTKHKVCPFCDLPPLSTGSCKILEGKKQELFEFLLNDRYYRIQGLYDFS